MLLDDIQKRKQFLNEYEKYLTKKTLYINNDRDNPEDAINLTYDEITQIKKKIKTL